MFKDSEMIGGMPKSKIEALRPSTHFRRALQAVDALDSSSGRLLPFVYKQALTWLRTYGKETLAKLEQNEERRVYLTTVERYSKRVTAIEYNRKKGAELPSRIVDQKLIDGLRKEYLEVLDEMYTTLLWEMGIITNQPRSIIRGGLSSEEGLPLESDGEGTQAQSPQAARGIGRGQRRGKRPNAIPQRKKKDEKRKAEFGQKALADQK